MGRRGVTSLHWGRYDSNRPSDYTPPGHIRFVPAEGKAPLPDPMCDYIDGAEWWLARSNYSIRALQRAFDEQEVACLLYERVGAMLEEGRTASGQYLIRIQIIRAGEWDTDISLSDAGIFLEEPWKGEED